jgi:molybdopterin-containing oxidoreductase family membrane subunit
MEVVASSFGDAATMHRYVPSLWELLLGIGGVALFLFMTVFALRILEFLPKSLADSAVDPHVKEG